MKKNSFGAGLIQRKRMAVMQNAQALLHRNLIDETSIYDDLNCGKLVKLMEFRVTIIMEYIEQLQAAQEDRYVSYHY